MGKKAFLYGGGGTWGRLSVAFDIPSYLLEKEGLKTKLQPKIRVITNKYGIRFKRDAKEYYPWAQGEFKMQTSNWFPIAIALTTNDPIVLFNEEGTLPHFPPHYAPGESGGNSFRPYGLYQWVERHIGLSGTSEGWPSVRSFRDTSSPYYSSKSHIGETSLKIKRPVGDLRMKHLTFLIARKISKTGNEAKHKLATMLNFESKYFVQDVQEAMLEVLNGD